MKEIMHKIFPIPFTERLIKSVQVKRACANYYRFADIAGKLRDLDSWVPNRLNTVL